MEKLLKWSLEAAASDGSQSVKQPDPAILNQLFGGKDEAQLMRESMQNIKNEKLSKDDRMTAFDDLEMLVESLDNANNIKPLNLWQDLISMLDSKDKDFQKMACWVIGTAVQNNPKSQKDLLDSRPLEALPKLLKLATSEVKDKETEEVVVKAIYALSSEIGHNEEAYDIFLLDDGWPAIAKILTHSATSEKIKIRALSLLRTLSTIEPIAERHRHLREANIVPTLLKDHLNSDSQATIRERTLGLFETLQEAKFQFTAEEKKDAKKLIEDLRKEGIIAADEFTMFS